MWTLPRLPPFPGLRNNLRVSDFRVWEEKVIVFPMSLGILLPKVDTVWVHEAFGLQQALPGPQKYVES